MISSATLTVTSAFYGNKGHTEVPFEDTTLNVDSIKSSYSTSDEDGKTQGIIFHDDTNKLEEIIILKHDTEVIKDLGDTGIVNEKSHSTQEFEVIVGFEDINIDGHDEVRYDISFDANCTVSNETDLSLKCTRHEQTTAVTSTITEMNTSEASATHTVNDDTLESQPEKVTWQQELFFITSIDFKFFWGIFDCRPFLYPITTRKLFFYAVYLLLIGAIFFSGAFLIFYEHFSIVLNLNVIPVLSFFIALDPFYIVLCVIVTKYPELESPDTLDPEKNKEIALIITCHCSNDLIQDTLRSALTHFPPQCIFVADNGNSETPMDNTRELTKEIHKDINYRWTSIGNKTVAQYLSVTSIMANNDLKYVIIVDDDVTFPSQVRFETDKINEEVKTIVYGIRGVDEQHRRSLYWTKWQDLEYKLSDLIKVFQSEYSTVLFPHGAMSLWCKKMLFRVLSHHDAIFYGDDVKMGLYLMEHGYRMVYYPGATVNTITPATLLGEAPNYYCQRVRSWDFTEHMLLLNHLKAFCKGHVKGSIVKTLWMKVFQFYVIYSIVTDWLRVLVWYHYLMYSPIFFTIIMVVSTLLGLASICLWNYYSCRNRVELRSSIITILTFPIYKFITVVIRLISLIRCYLVYWPRAKAKQFRPEKLNPERIIEIEKWMRESSEGPFNCATSISACSLSACTIV